MSKKRKIRVGLIFGGRSSEHEVSIASAAAVSKNLPRSKYEIIPFAIGKDGRILNRDAAFRLLDAGPKLLAQKTRSIVSIGQSNREQGTEVAKLVAHADKIDVFFPLLHGPYGEDGTIQGLLELLGRPFVGSDTLASALAMDKVISKKIFRAEGISTPDFWEINRDNYKAVLTRIKPPVVVKPINLGSSVGITIVRQSRELPKAAQIALSEDRKREAIIEKYISGREITVPVLGDRALPVIEIKPKQGWFDYFVKYNPALVEEIVPAKIGQTLIWQAQNLALKAHQALKCRHLSRTDMIIQSETNKIFVLEVNTMPGLTSSSLLPKSARAAGITFPKLIETAIALCLGENKNTPGNILAPASRPINLKKL